MLDSLVSVSTYAWSRLDLRAGLGLVRVETGDSIRVEGHEIAVDDHGSWSVTFDVRLDDDWRTRRAEIAVTGDHPRQVLLESDGAGIWHVDGAPVPDLVGCLDVDIAATPLTNTFVIRRLGLPIGGVGELRVVWVGVPDLEIAAMRQTYVHLESLHGIDRYEYRSDRARDGSVIEVDQDGIALHYEGFARRLYPDPTVS